MKNWQIRDYHEADWEQVRRIHDLARPIELEGSCDSRAFVPLADDENDLKDFQASKKLIASFNGQIAGFVGIDGDVVGWLYVDPRLARQGIGRRLLKAGLVHIESTASVYVLSGNAAALHLYESEGFKQEHRFPSDNNGYACTVHKLSLPDK